MGEFYFNRAERRKQPPKSGYGFLEAVVEAVTSHAGPLVEILETAHQHGGNPGYPAEAMLSAYVMQFALREPYANGFLDRLGGNERLIEICNLPHAPSEGAYSRFKKNLTNHVGLIQQIIADVFLECGVDIERLRTMGLVPADKPPLGESLVMDNTDVEAWARPGRRSRKTGEEKPPKDPNAKWGHRTAKNVRSAKPSSRKRGKGGSSKKGDSAGNDTKSGRKERKDEFYFGYKVNVIADANYGLPLFGVTRPANASDVVVMVQDLDDCLALYETLGPRYFLGDKGYDRLENIEHLVSLGLIPVVAVRLPEKDKETGKRLYDGIYDADGRPTCVGGKSMEYVETDPEKGHLFRCPAEGCHLKGKIHFSRYCDSEHYEKPEGRLLRIVGLLPRCSEEWKAKYKLRTVIERYFSSAKHSRLMNVHRVPQHQQGVATRRDVHAQLLSHSIGAPPGRRLRTHAAYEDQAAQSAGRKPKQATGADAGLPGPRLWLLCPVERSGVARTSWTSAWSISTLTTGRGPHWMLGQRLGHPPITAANRHVSAAFRPQGCMTGSDSV